MQPARLRDRRGQRILAADGLVRAVQAARAEEGAVAALVQGDEPQTGARLGGEAQARIDPLVPQLPGEEVAELVVADDATERGGDSETRETDRHVGRGAARVHLEPLAVAQPATAVGEEVHQRFAETEDVRRGHAPSISNRPISGTWSLFPWKGFRRSPKGSVPSRSSQRTLPLQKRWSRCMRRERNPAVGNSRGWPRIWPSAFCTPTRPASSVRSLWTGDPGGEL